MASLTAAAKAVMMDGKKAEKWVDKRAASMVAVMVEKKAVE